MTYNLERGILPSVDIWRSDMVEMITYIFKTCLKWPIKTHSPKVGFQNHLSLNAGQKYYRMLQMEHSAILSTFIKVTFVIKICVLSIIEWPLKTGFTVIQLKNTYTTLTKFSM